MSPLKQWLSLSFKTLNRHDRENQVNQKNILKIITENGLQ